MHNPCRTRDRSAPRPRPRIPASILRPRICPPGRPRKRRNGARERWREPLLGFGAPWSCRGLLEPGLKVRLRGLQSFMVRRILLQQAVVSRWFDGIKVCATLRTESHGAEPIEVEER